MFQYFFNRVLSVVFRPKKKEPADQRPPRQKSYKSQQVANRYCWIAMVLFSLQGLIALAGALELIFPDLPAPISFNAGRSVHLNLSIFWPLLGLAGAVYYFFIAEAQVELYSIKLAKIQFWLFNTSILAALTTLAFGLSDGREYLEAVWPIKIGFSISLALMAFNLIATLAKPGAQRTRPTVLLMITGVISAIILFLPNLFFYQHPTTDEIVKFFVVHLWEELSFEVMGAAVLGALLISFTGVSRAKIEKYLYLEAILALVTGLLATGHHYYWIGTPGYWLYVGGIASVFQVVPILLIVYSFYTSGKDFYDKLKTKLVAMALIGSSIFWHVLGAGFLGLIMAVPQINSYVHGTYITSAHSHLALFGTFGFFVLGTSFYILTQNIEGHFDSKRGLLALGALNGGLALMGFVLLIAGIVEVYLWRYMGLEFIEVQRLLWPYMLARGLGGLVYTGGAMLLSWEVISLQIRNLLAKVGFQL